LTKEEATEVQRFVGYNPLISGTWVTELGGTNGAYAVDVRFIDGHCLQVKEPLYAQRLALDDFRKTDGAA
jgi:hypothetical protein